MNIWALADLHLSLASPDKDMGLKFPNWKNYVHKIAKAWRKHVHNDDLVLIAGDISWALRLDDARVDFEWLASLPGQKVFIKGNHDFWFSSATKVRAILDKSVHLISNDAITFGKVTIGGTRLWEMPPPGDTPYTAQDRKIFEKELHRLRLSLAQLDDSASLRIAMTHYPPLLANLKPTQVSSILEEFNIDIALFGHLHDDTRVYFGELNRIKYYCTAADKLNFTPLLVTKI